MEKEIRRRFNTGTVLAALVAVGMFLASYTPAMASDRDQAQLLVDRARITLKDLMSDPNYSWLHDNIKHAKGVLIFPQVIKGGFV